MKTFISIFFAVILNAALFAQAPDTLWTRTFGGSDNDRAFSVQQTTDDGYIITGFFDHGFGFHDVWLIKTDANGDTLWTKTYDNGDVDEGYSVHQTLDGGYIITGHTWILGAGTEVWLIKTNANGDTMWTKTFGENGDDEGRSVQQTSDGGYVITGFMNPIGPSFDHVWLLRTDDLGDTLWTKTYGGSSVDHGHAVQQTNDGGYIITGTTQSFAVGNEDVWLIKTDVNGDTVWTKAFGGSFEDVGNAVRQTNDGGYIIAGYTTSFGSTAGDVWLIKTDANGDTVWTKRFGDASGERGHDVQQTADGGYIITGEENNNLWLVRTDADGNTLWTKTLGGFDIDAGHSVQQTSDGGYIVAGYTASFSSSEDFWLIRLAPDITAIDDDPQPFIGNYQLFPNYPNPFNPTTTINYQLAVSSKVELTVFNLMGQQIRTLRNVHQHAGAHRVLWNGRDESGKQVASGVYLYKLTVGNDFSETKKMVLIR